MKYFKRTFENRRVRLDSHEFRECTFNNCLLEVGGVPFKWGDGNHLIDSGFTFVGHAKNFLIFMQEFYPHPAFQPMFEELFANIRTGSIPVASEGEVPVKKFDA